VKAGGVGHAIEAKVFDDGGKPTSTASLLPSSTVEPSQAGTNQTALVDVDIHTEVSQFHFYHPLCGIKLEIHFASFVKNEYADGPDISG